MSAAYRKITSPCDRLKKVSAKNYGPERTRGRAEALFNSLANTPALRN